MLLRLVALLSLVACTSACSCLPRTFPEHYCSADAVLEVQFKTRRTAEHHVVYTGSVIAVWKGQRFQVGGSIQVVTKRDTATCGWPFFEVGCNAPTYLLTGSELAINAGLNQYVLSHTSCDFRSVEPHPNDVLRFLKNPSCPCSNHRCEEWQVCKVWTNPNCVLEDQVDKIDTAPDSDGDVEAPNRFLIDADGQADLRSELGAVPAGDIQDSGSLVSDVSVVRTCTRSYCEDTCKGFPCPLGSVCTLVERHCLTQPCPPYAKCIPRDPCATVLCLPGHKCIVDPNTFLPQCVSLCEFKNCTDGETCKLIPPRDCLNGGCPPVAACVPNMTSPCIAQKNEVQIFDEGEYIDVEAQAVALTAPDDVEEERWYFDFRENVCKVFKYRGSGGNDNNFLTIEECERQCPTIPVCKQAAVVGPCDAHIERWFFNQQTGQCEIFRYGGCRGNDNNFGTEEECYRTCPRPSPCALPIDEGSDTCTQASSIKWGHDPDTKRCRQFNYTGCGGNHNRFDTYADCQEKCPTPSPCLLKLDIGELPAGTDTNADLTAVVDPEDNSKPGVTRYWHNSNTLECEPFTYLGTGGNENRFLTIDACRTRCPHPNPCRLKPVAGPCRGSFRRWYYNYQNGRCETFTYGGCGGNRNNFLTQKKCHAKCAPVPVCLQPKVPGPCKARVPRFWYNRLTRRCERFFYGGCGGNRNNFPTLHSCQRRCLRKCQVPKPCDLIRCLPHQDCKVHRNGKPYCADNCDKFPCPDGFKCELERVYCFRAPCPPRAKCVRQPPRDPCEQDKDAGTGNQYIRRWYFDGQTGMCRMFRWSGRGGNSNNFKELSHCKRRCTPPGTCKLPSDSGACTIGVAQKRWFHNTNTGQCEEFDWWACGGASRGNRNRFLTQAACQKNCPDVTNPCRLPAYLVDCDRNQTTTPEWVYDAKNGVCRQLGDNRCSGNRNSFPTAAACESTCPVDKCKLPPVTGVCDCKKKRWYWNSHLGKCLTFEWGGCQSNGNNFETEDECLGQCRPDPNPCVQPLFEGRLTTKAMRYYWDFKIHRCRSFVYQGADGNANNFLTLEECDSTCNNNTLPCPGCTGAQKLTTVDVAIEVEPDTVENGYCCTRRLDGQFCCCPAPTRTQLVAAGRPEPCIVVDDESNPVRWYHEYPEEVEAETTKDEEADETEFFDEEGAHGDQDFERADQLLV